MYKIKMIESTDLHNDGIKLLKKMVNNNIELYYNDNGKPYLKDSNIYFNISHSFNRVICVISDKEIGIDIEKIRDVDSSVKKELKIKGNNIDFFKEWTRREAFIKKEGKSLKDIYNITYDNVDTTIVDNYVISIAK